MEKPIIGDIYNPYHNLTENIQAIRVERNGKFNSSSYSHEVQASNLREKDHVYHFNKGKPFVGKLLSVLSHESEPQFLLWLKDKRRGGTCFVDSSLCGGPNDFTAIAGNVCLQHNDLYLPMKQTKIKLTGISETYWL